MITLAGLETATALGPQLALHYTGGKASPGALRDTANFIAQVQKETWTVSNAGDGSGPVRLTGFAIVNAQQNSGLLGLDLVPSSAADKAAVLKSLSSGTHFKMLMPVMPGPDTIVEFSSDPENAGNIRGNVVSGGSHLGVKPGQTFSGPAIDHANGVEMTMIVARPGAKPTYAYAVVATRTASGLYLSGIIYNISQTRVNAFSTWDAIELKP